ncbi:PKD domain-containing protein [Catalinimonas alkaloidigena]|uniref:PKD domain-containing protein n=1 Tax=Catalinimonas alkaloidigena TaxID=1075417 RepID=UPI002405BF66|nr:PKD domain-containing protein [Catalinimonas alkaloidigena]
MSHIIFSPLRILFEELRIPSFKCLSKRCSSLLLIVGLSICILAPKCAFGQLPTDFQKVILLNGLKNSVNFEFSPDGRVFILDRYGEVQIYNTDTQITVSAGTIDVFHELEDGLLGIAFDPDFENNNYIYLHYSPASVTVNRVSRFQMNGDLINMSSEVVVLEWPTQRECCYHAAGDMAFDSQGNLYIATGDNTNHSQYSTLDETNPNFSSENTSSNTDDLRGKILRIKPQPDGTYTIPGGNLFPNGVDGRPEIYVMGARNPFKIFVDNTNTDWLFWGEVGPDANVDSNLGPRGLDEINLTKSAGNYGWPYLSGKNEPYLNTYSNPNFYYDPDNPVNLSQWNTGIVNLPPAQPSWLEFLHECYLAGPRYYYDPSIDNPKKLPLIFDSTYFYYDFNKSKVWVVDMDEEGNALSTEQLAPDIVKGAGFIDLKIGPDGQLYILEYGAGCCPSNTGTGKLVRIDFTGIDPNLTPQVNVSADNTSGAVPLTVNFSSAGTSDPNGDELVYEWDFQSDGTVDSNEENPTFTYSQAGIYDAQLRVDDQNGGVNAKSIRIYAGNNAPTFEYIYPPDGGMISWDDHIDFHIEVNDVEDGSTSDGSIDCSDLTVVPSLGHLNHFHDGLAINECAGTIHLDATGHNAEGEDDIFFVLNVNYTDASGLTSYDQISVHPKRMEAEFYDNQDKTNVIVNSDPLGGGRSSVRALEHNAYIVLSDRNLLNINSVTYRVASPQGGTIEIHAGSPSGPLLSTAPIPVTGSFDDWTNVEASVTDPGGKNDLYFVFKNSGNINLFDINTIEFNGSGISKDNTPPAIVSVEALAPNQVKVKFNELLQESSAEQTANYSINNGVSISSAVLQDDDRTVFLNISPLSSQVQYELTVNNIQNVSGIPLTQSLEENFTLSGSDVFLRINSGGPAVSLNNVDWSADQYSSGGSPYSNTSLPINNTTSDAIYQTELYGDVTYNIPVPQSGFYDINLHFAEIYHGVENNNGAGARKFDVQIEGGQYTLNDYDIIENAGATATAIIEEFKGIEVNDGTLTLNFTSVVDQAKVSAIEVSYGVEQTDPSITILSPNDGATVTQPFDVTFEIRNWEVGSGTTHFHLMVDGVNLGGVYNTDPITFNELSVGSHTIALELMHADHSPTGIMDQIQVNVVAGDCIDKPFPDQWSEVVIGSEVPYRSVYIFSGDIDGDGYKDIITGGWWYKNPGSPAGNWVQNTIGAPMNNMSLLHDFDNDGDLDVFGTQGTYVSAAMAWAENDGNGNFTIHTNIPAGTSTFEETFMAGAAVGNFNNVANTQIAIVWNGAESSDSYVQMLNVPTDPVNQNWTITSISPDSYGEAITAGDIDGDGDLDLFQGANWLRNEGGSWTTFSTGITLSSHFDRNTLADLDRDGILDGVVNQLGNDRDVNWFDPPADPTNAWTKKIIGSLVDNGLSLDVVDMDGDGDLDVLTGEWKGNHRLLAFENDLCNTGTWIQHVLHPGGPMDHHDGTQAVDIDNDGDLDIISIGWDVRVPRIYVNGSAGGPANDPPTVEAGPTQNLTLPANSTSFTAQASDTDGTITAYSWQQTNGPSTATLTNANTATLSVADLIEGTYTFEVTVTDDQQATAADQVQVIVSPQSGGGDTEIWLEAECITFGSSWAIGNSAAASNDAYLFVQNGFRSTGAAPTDPQAIATFSFEASTAGTYAIFARALAASGGDNSFWISINGGPWNQWATIVGNAFNWNSFYESAVLSLGTNTIAVAYREDGLQLDKLYLTLNANSPSGIGTVGTNCSGGPANDPPTVEAGPTQNLTLPANSTSFTAQASDTDGTITAYSWQQTSGPSTATLTNANTATLSVADLIEGTYTFEVTVTDDQQATAADQVQVIVSTGGPANDPPTVEAGPTQNLTLPANSTSFTAQASDTDGTITAYSWQQTNGPSTATLTNANTATLSVADLIEGTYTFEVTVTDDQQATAADQVQVIVSPQSGGGDTEIWLEAECITFGSSWAIGNSAAASNDAYLFVQNGFRSTGAAPTDPQAIATFSFEASTAGTYAIFARALAASGGDNSFWISINGGPWNQWATIVGNAFNWNSFYESAVLSLGTNTIAVAYREDGLQLDKLYLTLDANSPSGVGTVGTNCSGGPANDPPTVEAGPTQNLTLPANSTSFTAQASDTDGTITAYSWQQTSGPSTATLTNANTATLSVADLIEGTYTFEVTVTDDQQATAADQVQVIVSTGGPANDPPTVEAGPTQNLTLPANSTSFTAQASDTDGTITAYSWQQTNGPSTATLTNANTATLSVADLIEGTYTFEVTVTDDQQATAADQVQVIVSPQSGGGDTEIWLEAECITFGSSWAIGNSAAASNDAYLFVQNGFRSTGAAPTDPQAIATFSFEASTAGTYAIFARALAASGGDNSFWISINGGPWNQWATIVGNAFNWNSFYESAVLSLGTNTIAVAYREDGLQLDKLYLTLNANSPSGVGTVGTNCSGGPANDPPTVEAGPTQNLTLPANSTSFTAQASDTDGTITAYSWQQTSGPSTATLTNANTATLSVADLIEGTYTFEVTVTDDQQATAADQVQVIVSTGGPANDPPTVEAGPTQNLTLPANSTSFTAQASDTDGTITAYSWQQTNGPSTATLTNANTATLSVADLIEGTYTFEVTVTDDQQATAADQVQVIVSPQSGGGDTEIWLEAECITFGSSWAIGNSAAASNDAYLFVQNGFRSTGAAPTDPQAIATFSFEASTAGTYAIFARALAASGGDNSFWISINGGPWNQWATIVGNAFNWNSFYESAVLSLGTNTIAVAYREDGLQLDKLYLTLNANSPSGIGTVGTNCSGSSARLANLSRSSADAEAPSLNNENISDGGQYEYLVIHPNPFKEGIYISFSAAVNVTDYNFSLITNTGVELNVDHTALRMNERVVYLDLAPLNLSNGTYTLKLYNHSDKQHWFEKVVKPD